MPDSHRPPPQAPPLRLPPAVLHNHVPQPQPHPDSEESVQRERHRTSRELEPIREFSAIKTSSSEHHPSPHAPQARAPSIRSRGTLQLDSPHYGPSQISTAPDSDGPDAGDARRYRLQRQAPRWHDSVVRFWTGQVSVTIDEGSHRDHLALERTFLAYLRTSLAFAMTGVIIAQLFRLQHAVNPNLNLGFFVLGVPLAATFIGFGAVVLLVGAFRFWRQQNAMMHGKVYAGGWEISVVMVVSIALCLITFIFVTAIDIDKSYG